jgi:hypothetical protein
MPKKRIKVPTQCTWCCKTWLRRKGQKGDPCCSIECRTNIKAFRKGKVVSPWPQRLSVNYSKVHFKLCNFCGIIFASQFANKKYCSMKCQNICSGKAFSRVYFVDCNLCGKFTASRSKSKWCDTCQVIKTTASLSRVYFRNCQTCNKIFSAQSANKKYCSTTCISDSKPNTRPVYFQHCKNCGKLCALRSWNSKRCQPCQVLHEWQYEKDYDRSRTRVGKLIPYIGQRDHWKCSICHLKVKSKTYDSKNKWSPTIDHVVPVAEGGTDDLANLKLAHMICNSKKGKFGGNEQLLLVG